MNLAPDTNGSKTHLCWKRLKSCFRGDNLPALSKALLRGGRKYFLHTLALDTLLLCIVSNGFSFSYSNFIFALLFIEVSLKNVFACRLFRDTLLDLTTSHDDQVGTVEVKSQISQGIVFATFAAIGDVGVVEGDVGNLRTSISSSDIWSVCSTGTV